MDIVVPAFLHHSMIIPFVQISKNETIGSKNIHFILEIILIILKEEYMCKVQNAKDAKGNMVKSKFFFQLCSLATSQRQTLWPQSVEIIKLSNVIPWRHWQLASFLIFTILKGNNATSLFFYFAFL